MFMAERSIMLRRATLAYAYRWNQQARRIGPSAILFRQPLSKEIRALLSSTAASSTLLGHSPMAQHHSPGTGTTTGIPTAKDAEISGVWQTTTAKRDKLGELKGEAEGTSLDDMATETQKLDLYLVDGMQCIVAEDVVVGRQGGSKDDEDTATELHPWMAAVTATFDDDNLHEVNYMELLSKLDEQAHQQLLSKYPPDRCLRHVDDFMDGSQLSAEEKDQLEDNTNDFVDAVHRFRLQYMSACIQQMQSSWATWTTLSDQQVDRLAVEQTDTSNTTAMKKHLSTVPKDKVVAVIQSYLQGTGVDQLNAIWRLMDYDDDGLLDQEGMEHACKFAVSVAQAVLPPLLQDSLHARAAAAAGSSSSSWLQRRRQTRHHKELQKDLQRTVKNHFDVELEINHRLRCIYAWANKKHQDNKIDSVVVDAAKGIAAGVMGRKRYVELHPKISVDEFREVQVEHFPQIDTVAVEYAKSFREELLVRHGRGRQRKELIRDGSLFFGVVCVADYIILSL